MNTVDTIAADFIYFDVIQTGPDMRIEPRKVSDKSGKASRLLRDEVGSAVAEAAIVLPLLITVVLAAIQYSITMNIYMTATSAAAAGLQAFDTYRGISNSYAAATTAATTAAQLAAWKVASADVTVQLWVGSTQCSSNSACDLLLTNNGPPGSGGPGALTKIQVQIACNGLNFLPALPSFCPVVVNMNGVVQ